MVALIIIIAIVLGLILLINSSVVNSVNRMNEPESLFSIKEQLEDEGFQKAFNNASIWAQKNGYNPDKLFEFYGLSNGQAIKGATWLNQAEGTILALYYAMDKSHYDLVTIYNDDIGLTTTNSKDAFTLPQAPKAFTQAFPQFSLDDLFHKHLKGRKYLEEKLQLLTPNKLEENTVELMSKAIKRQMSYIRSLPFWGWQGAYWYFIRRNLKSGKEVSAQNYN